METGRRQTAGMQKRSSTPAAVIVVNDNRDQLDLLCATLQKKPGWTPAAFKEPTKP